MQRRLLPSLLTAALLVQGLGPLLPSTAQAQTAPAAAPAAPAKPLAESLQGSAKNDYDLAMSLYKSSPPDYSNAYDSFKRAYDTSKDARLLWNMAACQKQMRHYTEVRRLTQAYLKESAGQLSEADALLAKNLLDTMDKLVSPLSITVNENGAEVFVDDVAVGKSPFTAPHYVDAGTHKVRATKSDFKDFNGTIEARGGVAKDVAITLERMTREGRVTVKTGVADAAIVIDGRAVGRGDFYGAVSSGTHVLRVTANGKVPYEADFVLLENGTRSFDITLQNEKKPIPAWVWIGGGVLVAGGLSVAGYFLFKPGDKAECSLAPSERGSVPACDEGTQLPNVISFTGL